MLVSEETLPIQSVIALLEKTLGLIGEGSGEVRGAESGKGGV